MIKAFGDNKDKKIKRKRTFYHFTVLSFYHFTIQTIPNFTPLIALRSDGKPLQTSCSIEYLNCKRPSVLSLENIGYEQAISNLG